MKTAVKLITACVGFAVLWGTLSAQTLTIQSVKKQQMRYGMDFERLWYWYGPQANLNQCAQWAVVNCDLDYLRVAIDCEYELQEGVYNLSAYTSKILPMMTTMKTANPNIKFFATPRPLNEAIDGARWQPYPYWITGDPGDGSSFNFNWQKCAEYLVRYVNLMKSYGFKIDYIDVTNEWNYITATHVRDISSYMKTALGNDMPLIVAPSAWSFSQGVSWLNAVNTDSKKAAIDIASCHNTGYQGTAQEFADKAMSLGKETWDSEVHGWKGDVPAEEIPTSNQIFDRIRAGFSGLDSWLAIGTTAQQHCYFLNNGSSVTRNVKYYIFKKLSTTSNYGHALSVNLPPEFASTAALIRDNLLTIWVLNNSSVDVLNVDFVVNDQNIADIPITSTQWHSSIAITGQSSSITKSSINQFQSTIKANSLYCFEVRLALSGTTGTLQSHYAFDGNTNDSSEFLRHGTAGNDEVYSTGIMEQAMVFDGINDSVAIPGYKGILGTQSRTCAAWIKTPGMASNTVILNWGAAASGQQWIFGLFSTGELSVYAGGPYIKTTALVNDNQWHHVAAALTDDGSPDVSEIKLYIDGVLQTTANTPGAVNTVGSYDVLMGAFWNGSSPGGFFKGLLDEVRIYGGALNEYGIAALYFQCRPDSKICLLNENDLQYDYTADCQVDLSDAAVLSSRWLFSTGNTDLAGLASEWLMTDLYSALMLETIFEPFDLNPYSSGWGNAQAGNTTFTYNAAGYIDAAIYRDSTNTARFYKALNRNYDQTDEFWFEYDAQIVSATSPLQRAAAGLFNSSIPDNHHDMIGTRFAYWVYNGSPRGNRHDLYCYATDGTPLTSLCDPIDPGIAYGQNIRVKLHYWYESAVGKASLNIYAINTDGSTGSLIMAAPTATVIGTGKTLILNSMGVGNRTDGTDDGKNNIVKIDNIYFSPIAENPAPRSPSF